MYAAMDTLKMRDEYGWLATCEVCLIFCDVYI